MNVKPRRVPLSLINEYKIKTSFTTLTLLQRTRHTPAFGSIGVLPCMS